MANFNDEEKQLLLVSRKIRMLVKADIEKTANPALLALIEGLSPTLAKLSPKLVGMVKSIPPEAWGQIAQHLVQLISHAADAASKMASTKAKAKGTVQAVEKILTKANVAEAKTLASQTVLATLHVAANQRKTPSPKLTEAVATITKAREELALLREFV